MSSRRVDQERLVDDNLDGLIRWALHDSVADAEPSSEVWSRIQHRIKEEPATSPAPLPGRRQLLPRRRWLAWLIGAGAHYPVPGDPRSAWQRRLHAFDMRAPLSVVRIVEAKMPAMRIVA